MQRGGWIVVVALLASGGVAGCGASESPFTAQGTVEVREVDVAPIAAGRVLTVRVDEGDRLRQGDTIAVLTTPTLAADLDAAVARQARARARLRDLEAGARPQEIAAARAAVVAGDAEAARTARDRDRLETLLRAGAVAARDVDLAATAARVAASDATRAREALALAEAGRRGEQIAAAQSEVAAATAALEAQRATTADYVLRAPVDGVVFVRAAEPGDLLTTGEPVVRLGRPGEPWVRVYVPAHVLPMLSVGDSVRVVPPGAGAATTQPDGQRAPDSVEVAVAGRVVAIGSRAEYVTRTALTETERADLLFAVKVAILDSTGRLKAGMPATVVFGPGVTDHD
jgi:HlyD family secretion protein